MSKLCLILGDQLSDTISSLKVCDAHNDTILMCEVWQETVYVKHHKKKIAFLFSAMRHFANTLKKSGFKVNYIKLDDPNNTGSFRNEVRRQLELKRFESIVVTTPGEYRLLKDFEHWQEDFGIPVSILQDDRFLSTPEQFAQWAKGRKQLRMEYFYRHMRKQYHILMTENKPLGGQWNYDAQNRKPPKQDLTIPTTYISEIDHITQEVITLVGKKFADHFGALEPFYFAVTRKQALLALQLFIRERLKYFGDYQDAMLTDEPWMYHSHLSFYLNAGLLLPLECIQAAEAAYYKGLAPLNAVEGFIRQILGWREYVRGLYWFKMPGYATDNFFAAKRKLPDFYWTANTKMNCLHQCVKETQKHAYAHHIQRLMVLGNFALIAGVDPCHVNEWFLIVYADAYEWVELPNVSGMILFADGGYLASKPYAASGNYIHKMSDYCQNCAYKVTKKTGANACPFNYLYWDFLIRNRQKLQLNQRMSMMYKIYDRIDSVTKQAIQKDSKKFLEQLS